MRTFFLHVSTIFNDLFICILLTRYLVITPSPPLLFLPTPSISSLLSHHSSLLLLLLSLLTPFFTLHYRSIADCFKEAHESYADIPEVATQIRKGAALCRQQLMESTKMLRKVLI